MLFDVSKARPAITDLSTASHLSLDVLYAFLAMVQANICTVAYGLFEEQSAITDEYKDLLDQGVTDCSKVPDEMQKLALTLLIDCATDARDNDVHTVIVAFPTSSPGTAELMHNTLLDASFQLSSELQGYVSVEALLSRSTAVTQRSGVSSTDRHTDAAEQLATLRAVPGTQRDPHRVKYVIVDDLRHTGNSLRDGECTAVLFISAQL